MVPLFVCAGSGGPWEAEGVDQSQRVGRRGRLPEDHLRRSVTTFESLQFKLERVFNVDVPCISLISPHHHLSVLQAPWRERTAESWRPRTTWTASWWAEPHWNPSSSTSSTRERNRNRKTRSTRPFRSSSRVCRAGRPIHREFYFENMHWMRKCCVFIRANNQTADCVSSFYHQLCF